jgi:hypothetical protein
MKYLAVLALLCVAIPSFILVQDVQACSGGGENAIQDDLSWTDYVVKAEVVSVDDVRQNAILRAESYLFGGAGPEYLAFVQNDPAIITRITEGDPYGNCRFFKPELNVGFSAYFFLNRRPDGAYRLMDSWNGVSYYAFPDASTTTTLYSHENGRFVNHELNEQDFVDFITRFGESTVTEPDSTFIYPRLAPLKITTVNGTNYVLPVDSGVPVEATSDFINEMSDLTLGPENADWNESYFTNTTCPGDGCIQVSPDGINRAEQDGEQIRWFGGSATGRAFQFSSVGDAIAVWNEDRIEFYTLGWAKRDQDFEEVTLFNAVVLAGDDVPYQSAWSPDGRIFAYSDAEGLWSVDVYNPAAEPVSLITTESGAIPVALGFSPLGRYLQVERGDERLTLDTISGDVFPDGLVSPDDQILLAFDTRIVTSDVQLCYLAPVTACEPLDTLIVRDGSDDGTVFNRFAQVQWRNRFSFIATICGRDNEADCVVNDIYSVHCCGSWYNSEYDLVPGYTFDYFAPGDVLAVAQDGFIVAINGEAYDLSAVLDSPIATIEWLPSLFYDDDSRT